MRRLLIIVAVAWLPMAWVYWMTEVPLIPAVVFRDRDGLGFRGFGPEGELVVVHVRAVAGQPGRSDDVGPVEFWSFPQLVKQRELFTSEDIIETLSVERHRPTIVRRVGQPWISDLERGQLQHRLPQEQAYRSAWLAGGNRVLWTEGLLTTCFDFVEQTELWTLADHEWPQIISPRIGIFQRVFREGEHPHITDFRDPIDLATGQVDGRLKELGIINWRDSSPDGRLAAVLTEQQFQMIDVDSARVVWESTPMVFSFGNARFSPLGEELIIDRVTPEGAVLTTRIQASDGQIIEPGPGLKPKFITVTSPTVTVDRRFAIFDLLRKPSPLNVALRELRMKATVWFRTPWPGQVKQRSQTAIVDLASGRRAGFVDALNRRWLRRLSRMHARCQERTETGARKPGKFTRCRRE